jgi:hypothetical protein
MNNKDLQGIELENNLSKLKSIKEELASLKNTKGEFDSNEESNDINQVPKIVTEKKFEETLDVLDKTSPYALTGSIISNDRSSIELASYKLRNAAGNFYINDKPTGAVVGQQPFGGARASGTNDKAGSMLNLYRWLSARTVKETFNPPTDYRYPFMQPE